MEAKKINTIYAITLNKEELKVLADALRSLKNNESAMEMLDMIQVCKISEEIKEKLGIGKHIGLPKDKFNYLIMFYISKDGVPMVSNKEEHIDENLLLYPIKVQKEVLSYVLWHCM